MCGISGVFALEGPLDPRLREGARAMNACLAHRGPDGDGFHDDEAVALGHRRLAIIDRAGGAQPMSNEDGSCWIVFNGEIYNHRALRPVLEARGHRFRTTSDTEAILHAYEEYGPACVDRLAGMFAFAIYDGRTRELFVARDRLGKKPLYYAVLDGALHVASEVTSLQRSPAWKGDIDLSALEGYLSLGYFLAPQSPWRGVHKLEPGCWLRARDGRIETRRYWDVTDFDTHQGPKAECRRTRDVVPQYFRIPHSALRASSAVRVPSAALLPGAQERAPAPRAAAPAADGSAGRRASRVPAAAGRGRSGGARRVKSAPRRGPRDRRAARRP
jgi:asparagine synthase (glutamine-hydrolysing)